MNETNKNSCDTGCYRNKFKFRTHRKPHGKSHEVFSFLQWMGQTFFCIMADEMNTLLLQYYFHELILQMPSYNYDILKGKHSGRKYASFEGIC